jgi:hypothetical protein
VTWFAGEWQGNGFPAFYHASDLEPAPGTCRCGCGKQTRVSPVTNTRCGYVKGQPRPYVLGHNSRTRSKP